MSNDMGSRTTLGDRAAYITDGGRTLPDHGQVTDVRLIGELLADASTWTEPRPRLEHIVIDSVTELATGSRRPRRRAATVGAALVIVLAAVAIVFAIVAREEPHAEFDAELRATAAAPKASASAEMYRNHSGFRVVLDARDLPLLPAGEYYQAWLKNAAGVVIPIGTFSSSRDEVTLWSGASTSALERIMVTVDSAVAESALSDRVVLVGAVRPR